MAAEDDVSWVSSTDEDALWDYVMEHHCNEIWPFGDFRWQPNTIYIPYYRQLRTGRRWAEMTYAGNARKTQGGQDDPEWDHMLVTAVIGMDGETYDVHGYELYYQSRLYMGDSPSRLRQKGHTHDLNHHDARGPALSDHICRPPYRLPNTRVRSVPGVCLFSLSGNDICDVMQGLLTRTFNWPHMGAINVTSGDQFPWRVLFRIHPYGRTLVGAGIIRILICSDTEHTRPYFLIHRQAHGSTLGGQENHTQRLSLPDLLVQYPYLEPQATHEIECMRRDLYHDARILCAHWRDFYPHANTDLFRYLDASRICNVREYQEPRCVGRAHSETRAGVIEEAKHRMTDPSHRFRSLSLDRRIIGAQRVAGLVRGSTHASEPPSGVPRGRGR